MYSGCNKACSGKEMDDGAKANSRKSPALDFCTGIERAAL